MCRSGGGSNDLSSDGERGGVGLCEMVFGMNREFRMFEFLAYAYPGNTLEEKG